MGKSPVNITQNTESNTQSSVDNEINLQYNIMTPNSFDVIKAKSFDIQENLEQDQAEGIVQINGQDIEIGKDEIAYRRKDGEIVRGKLTKRNSTYENAYWFKSNDDKQYTITQKTLEEGDTNKPKKIRYMNAKGNIIEGEILVKSKAPGEVIFKSIKGQQYSVKEETINDGLIPEEQTEHETKHEDLFKRENKFRNSVKKTSEFVDKITSKTQTISTAAMLMFVLSTSTAGSIDATTITKYKKTNQKALSQKDIQELDRYLYAAQYDKELLTQIQKENQENIKKRMQAKEQERLNTPIKQATFEEAKKLAYTIFGKGPATDLLITLSDNKPDMMMRVIALANWEGGMKFGRKNDDMNRGQINRGSFQISDHPKRFVKGYNKRVKAGIKLLEKNNVQYEKGLFKKIKSYYEKPGENWEEIAQNDLLVRLGHVQLRWDMEKRIHKKNNTPLTEKNFFMQLADTEIDAEALKQLIAKDIQGGIKTIGQKVIKQLEENTIGDYEKIIVQNKNAFNETQKAS